MRVFLSAAAAVAVLVSAEACGVSQEDEPQLIEESTGQRPAATPSFDAVTSAPATTTTAPSASSTLAPPR